MGLEIGKEYKFGEIDKISENILKGIESGLAKAKKNSSEIECPFCDEKGFDLAGLKHHLNTYCQAFDETKSI